MLGLRAHQVVGALVLYLSLIEVMVGWVVWALGCLMLGAVVTGGLMSIFLGQSSLHSLSMSWINVSCTLKYNI